METGQSFDPARLHQEAVLLATRADVEEELRASQRSRRGRACPRARRRRRRPKAGFPGAGVQPRSQHPDVEGRRPGHRPQRSRPQGGHRSAARAGPEHRVGLDRLRGRARINGGKSNDNDPRAEPLMTIENPSIERRGLLLVLSSPSGAGQDLARRALLESDHDISLSISVTTRTPRPRRGGWARLLVCGRDPLQGLARRRPASRVGHRVRQLLRHATRTIEQAVAEGRDVLFDIDWPGTQQLSERMAGDLVRVFVLSPSRRCARAATPAARTGSARRRRKRMAKAAYRNQPLGRIRLRHRQRRIWRRASRG